MRGDFEDEDWGWWWSGCGCDWLHVDGRSRGVDRWWVEGANVIIFLSFVAEDFEDGN